jgi:methionine-gamma-lyase
MTSVHTSAIHADRHLLPAGAVVAPISQAATFAAPSTDAFADAATQPRSHEFYTRYGNPTHAHVSAVIEQLEGAEASLVTASGMAALTTALLTLLHTGDHVIAQQHTYGGTAAVVQDLLPRLGVSTTQVDQTDTAALAAAFTSTTRVVLIESPSNPLLRITDVRAVCELAHRHHAIVIADNTVATPINQRPLAFGVDLVWHSATKYLNGHSDVVAGVLAGSRALIDRIWQTSLLTGATLSPHDSWLLLRGMRTLPLRMTQHNSTAMTVATALDQHPRVRAVHYPGLPSHRDHHLASTQMTGYGGLISVELDGDADTAERFISGLQLPKQAASLGGISTLVVHPAAMWKGMLDQDRLAQAHIPSGLVRIAVGLEDVDDLLTDIDTALRLT